jgi:hypothetical protein
MTTAKWQLKNLWHLFDPLLLQVSVQFMIGPCISPTLSTTKGITTSMIGGYEQLGGQQQTLLTGKFFSKNLFSLFF